MRLACMHNIYAINSVAAPGGFLGFLETGHPSHKVRHVTSNGRHGHSYEQREGKYWLHWAI